MAEEFKMTLFLHAGLPRTATTVMQRAVFPNLRTISYVGKHADNIRMSERFAPARVMLDECRRHTRGDAGAMHRLRRIVPSVLLALTVANVDNREWRRMAESIAECLDIAANEIGPHVLYSDESLVESASGQAAELRMGDAVPLEQLHAIGLLQRARLSVVLRDPIEFLTASYYKSMENHRLHRFSFDEYIRRQLVIYERKPSASRIFLCLHRTAAAHFRKLCPATVAIDYRQLIAANHALDMLLGTRTGEAAVPLHSLPRENRSWRRAETNALVLGAPGVPTGMSIEAYARSFPETLERYGLGRLFAEEAEGH